MPGLIDEGGTTGLAYTTGTGLDWLESGIGGPLGLIIGFEGPSTDMLTETGAVMITETGDFMVTE